MRLTAENWIPHGIQENWKGQLNSNESHLTNRKNIVTKFDIASEPSKYTHMSIVPQGRVVPLAQKSNKSSDPKEQKIPIAGKAKKIFLSCHLNKTDG